MIQKNKLDQSFGPVGSIAGITIFVVGLALILYSLAGLILILIGAFVGLTYTSTTIDFDKKRVRFSNNIFGFLQIGKWVNLEKNMKITISQSNRAWRAYSRGSRSIDLISKDFRLVLMDGKNRQIMPLMKTPSLELAKNEIELLIDRLELDRG